VVAERHPTNACAAADAAGATKMDRGRDRYLTLTAIATLTINTRQHRTNPPTDAPNPRGQRLGHIIRCARHD
jgi:secreted PhoX family phosphatase